MASVTRLGPFVIHPVRDAEPPSTPTAMPKVTARFDAYDAKQSTPVPSASSEVTIPSRPIFDTAPSAIDLATQLRRAIVGLTGHRDERAIVSLLREAATTPGGVGAALYELALTDPSLPDKMVRDVADRSLTDRLSGRSDTVTNLWSALSMPGTPPSDHAAAVRALRARAIQLASRTNPTVRTYVTDRLQRTDGPVTAFGSNIERLEPRRHSGPTFGEKLVKAGVAAFDQGPLSQAINSLTGTYNPQTKSEIARVLASPPVKDASGQPVKLGDITVMVNGTFNLSPSAALVFRAAQHSGKVVIAGANANGPDALKLRELTEIRGEPIPASLKGKIFGIGNLEPTFMTWPQASDLLLEQLDALSTQLGGALQDPSVKTTMLAFSSGALSAVAARRRLEDAGHGNVVDQLVTVAGALGGSPFAEAIDDQSDLATGRPWASRLGPVMGRLLQTLDAETGRAMFNSTDPDAVAHWREELKLTPDLVNLAYVASADGADQSKVEPLFKLNHTLLQKVPGLASTENDGMVYADQKAWAQRVVKDPVAKTHLLEWKDPATLDVVLNALAA